jgi:hypothetical protein
MAKPNPEKLAKPTPEKSNPLRYSKKGRALIQTKEIAQQEEKERRERATDVDQHAKEVKEALTDFANAVWGKNSFFSTTWTLEEKCSKGTDNYRWKVAQKPKRNQDPLAAPITTDKPVNVAFIGARAAGYQYRLWVEQLQELPDEEREIHNQVSLTTKATARDLRKALSDLYLFLEANPDPTRFIPIGALERRGKEILLERIEVEE